MANSIATYTDSQIMKCFLTKNFSDIGGEFIDDVVTKVKAGAFYNATNLTKVSLPSVTEIETLAFAKTSIGTLDLDWSKITKIYPGAFNGGFAGLPANLVLTSLTAIGTAAFLGTSTNKNTKLQTVSLPIWTGTSVSQEGIWSNGGIFGYCSQLTSVSAPELLAIPSDTFQYCTALTEVSFPKAASIGGSAFTGCTNLTKIDVGGDVTALSSKFINSATKMEAIILRGITAVPRLGSSTFTSTRVATGACYVYVPRSLEATVKVASNWTTYAAQGRLRTIQQYAERRHNFKEVSFNEQNG